MSKYYKFLPQIAILFALYAITGGLFFTVYMYSGDNTGNFSLFQFILLMVSIPIFMRYFLNVFLSPFYSFTHKRRLRKFVHKNYHPKVSVIIPAWNEEVGIGRTMQSVLDNSYPDIELIVVNDGSTDSTEVVVKEFIQKFKNGFPKRAGAIKYIYQHNAGKPAALNLGVKDASGEIIVTTDADSFMDKFAIEKLVNYFRNPEIVSVAGNVRIGNNNKTIGLIQTLEYIYGFYFKKADSIVGSVYIVGGAAAAYRREVFDKLGMFDETTITEDIEMSTRIQKAGVKIAYASDVIVYTEGPSDLSGLIKQRLRWKRGRFETFIEHKDLFFSTDKRHNKYLSWVVLPLAMLSEILLLLEIFVLPYFLAYTIIHSDFLIFAISAIILGSVVSLTIWSDSSGYRKFYLMLWAPVSWLVFYYLDFVEYNALFKSLVSFIVKKEIKWQRWNRVGVFEN
jgi:poly-beta-1,6-N-acetyl-D-glucosamine synthase